MNDVLVLVVVDDVVQLGRVRKADKQGRWVDVFLPVLVGVKRYAPEDVTVITNVNPFAGIVDEQVKMHDGSRRVDVEPVEGERHLAVAPFPMWSVVHMPTGISMVYGFYTAWIAQRAIADVNNAVGKQNWLDMSEQGLCRWHEWLEMMRIVLESQIDYGVPL